MADREPSDTMENVVPDDDETLSDLPHLSPSYDHAPATIEERLSPFHDSADIRVPTVQGMPSLKSQGFVAPELGPEAAGTPPDGPTDPQGVPMLAGLQEHANPHGPATWDEATETTADPRVQQPPPEVPSPDAPNILISKSMELQVAKLDEDGEPLPPPTEAPKVRAASPRARAAAQPTEVLLPALKRRQKRDKESSDLPLVLGLVALVAVIAGIVVLVVLGVMGQLGG
jgi:hypothetical protein